MTKDVVPIEPPNDMVLGEISRIMDSAGDSFRALRLILHLAESDDALSSTEIHNLVAKIAMDIEEIELALYEFNYADHDDEEIEND